MTADAQTQKRLEIEAAQINAGKRMKEIMDDAVVKAAFKSIEDSYLAEFLAANTDEARRNVWAKRQVLDDIATRFRATFDGGLMVAAQRDSREAQEARLAGRTTRK